VEIKGSVEMNVAQMQASKAKAVKGLTGGIEQLFKKNKVDYIKAHATIKGKNDIELSPIDGSAKSTINSTNIIIATGSVPATLPGLDGASWAEGKAAQKWTAMEAFSLGEWFSRAACLCVLLAFLSLFQWTRSRS